MKVPHLNEFLRKAIESDILHNVLIDFSAGNYCRGKTVRVVEDGSAQLSLYSEGGLRWGWGLKSDSVEIVGIRSRVTVHGRTEVILKVGRKCNPRGELR